MCIRMGSLKMVTTSIMLYYAFFKATGKDVPWAPTDTQPDPLSLLEEMDNVI